MRTTLVSASVLGLLASAACVGQIDTGDEGIVLAAGSQAIVAGLGGNQLGVWGKIPAQAHDPRLKPIARLDEGAEVTIETSAQLATCVISQRGFCAVSLLDPATGAPIHGVVQSKYLQSKTAPTTGGVGFGFPVGDRTTYPAGGWVVTQELSHYLPMDSGGGRHLAVDLAPSGSSAIDAPVYAVGDGEVLYAGPNGSTYKNDVLIRHHLGDGSVICSFYGHLNAPNVSTGQTVHRGQQISSVIDYALADPTWAAKDPAGASANSHLHYVMLSPELCDLAASAGGGDVCGYDNGGANNVTSQADEPASYTSVGDICGDQAYAGGFLSPTQFIAAHPAQ